MIPTLRKHSQTGISRREIARLLERHAGSGSSASHCEAVLEALRRIRDPETNAGTRVLARMLKADGNPCDTVRQVIEQLRSNAWNQT